MVDNLGPGIFVGCLIGGALGGCLTGLYFHWLEPGFHWKRVFLITGCWAACGLIAGLAGLISNGLGALFIGLPFSIITGSAFLFWLLWRSHNGS